MASVLSRTAEFMYEEPAATDEAAAADAPSEAKKALSPDEGRRTGDSTCLGFGRLATAARRTQITVEG